MWFRDAEKSSTRQLPEMLTSALDLLDIDSIILGPGEVPLYISEGVEALGILRDGRITSPEFIALSRVVRRTNKPQKGKISVARGPIGEGVRELTVQVIPLSDGTSVLAQLSDETEQERINDIRRDFVANISHELKTPIGALSLLSEAVLSAKDEPEAVTKFATRMAIESKRLTDLVQEIINLSRLQDSDPLEEAQVFDANDFIVEGIDRCRTVADSRNIEVVFSPGPDVAILGDREQLVMAVHNLIENAINYSPEGTSVSVTTEAKDGILHISVADQGIGIPEADLERIFERFYRVDPARSRETGGTGLGLSIVKHVAIKHGGDINVWSSKGIGSTFELRLPIHTSEEKVG